MLPYCTAQHEISETVFYDGSKGYGCKKCPYVHYMPIYGHDKTFAREECSHSQTAWAADKEYCVFCGNLTGQVMIRPQRLGYVPITEGLNNIPVIEEAIGKSHIIAAQLETLPECCGSLVKEWQGGKWVCHVCKKDPYPTGSYYSRGSEPKKCECGSAVCGLNHHSSWCPLFDERNK